MVDSVMLLWRKDSSHMNLIFSTLWRCNLNTRQNFDQPFLCCFEYFFIHTGTVVICNYY